jgi:hypothetical protein
VDLKERLEALSSRNDEPPIPTTYPLSDEELKTRYLDMLEEGLTQQEAAAQLGKTASWLKGFRNPKSPRYDSAHAEMYEEIMALGGPNRRALGERAFASLVKAAEEGNVRAAEKILMAYHEDFQFLRPVAALGDTNIDKLLIVMDGVPTPILEQAREALLQIQQKQRELPVIEA